MKWCDYQIINPTEAEQPAYVHYFLESDHFSVSGIPYILESNVHPFYSFRGLKKSDAY
jgi:hypothetical protein